MSNNTPGGRLPGLRFTDLRPTPDDILGDVLAGLGRHPRRLPSKYFYDAEGSRLFEAITRQPEYYPTRVELALLETRGADIAAAVGPRVHVVEYGSGSGRKTRLLLEALEDPVAYTPIEISRTALLASVEALARDFDRVELLPACADFTQPVPLPAPARTAARSLVFFPGSTLGNFAPDEAVSLLRSMRGTVGGGGAALVGIDLVKDAGTLHAAYNDAAGVTAAFTLNLLARLNREIGSDFDLQAFSHVARYVPGRQRIETFLASHRDQRVTVGGRHFDFAAGEEMLVEYSHKYDDTSFEALAAAADLRVAQAWNDPRGWFGLRLLVPA